MRKHLLTAVFLPLCSSAAACERASGRHHRRLHQMHHPLLPAITQCCCERTPEMVEILDRHMVAVPRWMRGWRPHRVEKDNWFQVEFDRMLTMSNRLDMDVTGKLGDMEFVDQMTTSGPCLTVQMSTVCKQHHVRMTHITHSVRSTLSQSVRWMRCRHGDRVGLFG